MKCQEIQELLFEYVEGSLPHTARADVDAHLEACEACTEAVRREKQLDARLGSGLRESVQNLTLGNSGRERLLNAMARDCPSNRPGWLQVLTNRWAAMTAVLGAAAALIAMAFWFWNASKSEPKREAALLKPASAQTEERKPTIQVKLPYIVRSYTFRQNGDFVVDTLVEQTNTVNVTLWVKVSESVEPRANDRKL